MSIAAMRQLPLYQYLKLFEDISKILSPEVEGWIRWIEASYLMFIMYFYCAFYTQITHVIDKWKSNQIIDVLFRHFHSIHVN